MGEGGAKDDWAGEKSRISLLEGRRGYKWKPFLAMIYSEYGFYRGGSAWEAETRGEGILCHIVIPWQQSIHYLTKK